MELTAGETFFIEVVREFDFLRMLGYKGEEFNIVGKEFYIKFINKNLSLSIIIVNSEHNKVEVFIERKLFWGYERKNIKEFNTRASFPNSIKSFAKLIQREFLYIIKGENKEK